MKLPLFPHDIKEVSHWKYNEAKVYNEEIL